jgi:hypothetical protein
LTAFIHDPSKQGVNGRYMASILNERKLRRVLEKMLDEEEFFSPYGIRSLSKFHDRHPYVFGLGGQEFRVSYLPAESDSGMFGGNSNWRGPIWMPVNGLVIRALLQYYRYYGDAFTVECPTGSGRQMNLYQVAEELTRRLTSLFTRGEDGRRAVYGGTDKFQQDPHWRDLILFYEYFHGDNGAGIGASHQTGWTGIIARLMQLFGVAGLQRWLHEDIPVAAAAEAALAESFAAATATTPPPPPKRAPARAPAPGREPQPAGAGDAKTRPGAPAPAMRQTDPGPDKDRHDRPAAPVPPPVPPTPAPGRKP